MSGIGLICGFVLSVVVLVYSSEQLNRDLNDHALAVARAFASYCQDAHCASDSRDSIPLLAMTLQSDPDMAFITVLTSDGRTVLSQARPRVPAVWLADGKPEQNELDRPIARHSSDLSYREVTEPLEQMPGYVRVGVSDARIGTALEQLTIHLIIATLLAIGVGALISTYFAQWLIRPIHRLIHAVQSISLERVPSLTDPTTSDEVGELSRAVNAMTIDLARSRDALLNRNRELGILNVIAQTISGSLNLSHILQTTLQKVLHQLDLPAGWILLAEFGHDFPLSLAAHIGLSETFVFQEMTEDRKDCICLDVLESGNCHVAEDQSLQCPYLAHSVFEAEGLVTHASIPLVSSGQVVGIMNVAAKTPRIFTDAEINLMCSIGRQVGIAVDKARLWEAVQRTEAMRGRLLEKVFRTQEDERQRIALELHDQIGSSLASVGVRLRILEQASASSASAQAEIADLETEVDKIAQEMHKIALDLRPTVLDQLGLIEAVEQTTKSFAREHHLQVEFNAIHLDGQRLPPEIETGLYRIVQEALNNVARHAHASEVNIMLDRRATGLVLMIEDNGHGFQVSPTEFAGEHLGLFGMQERATQLGGQLTIESTPGHGTTIYAQVPMGRNDV